MHIRSNSIALTVALVLAGIGYAQTLPNATMPAASEPGTRLLGDGRYHEPDVNNSPLTVIDLTATQETRSRLATLLGTYACNEMKYTRPQEAILAGKLLGLALPSTAAIVPP